jgi:hypothetical protein
MLVSLIFLVQLIGNAGPIAPGSFTFNLVKLPKASKGLGVFFWLNRPIDIESKGYTQD